MFQVDRNVSRIWFKRGLTAEDRAKYWGDSMDNIQAFETELSSRGSCYFGGEQPGWLDYMVWPWFERLDAYSTILKVEKHSYHICQPPHLIQGRARVPEGKISSAHPVDGEDDGGSRGVRVQPGHRDTRSVHQGSYGGGNAKLQHSIRGKELGKFYYFSLP